MKTIFACIFLVAIIASVANAQIAPNPTKPYSFAYEVVDPAGGNAYGHRETSNGAGLIEGEYRNTLPDGRIQHVKYSVTAKTGYVAEVAYEGTAVAAPVVAKSERLTAIKPRRQGR